MTDISQGKLTFDFNTVVQDAREMHPEKLRYTTFVNLDEPDASAMLSEWRKKSFLMRFAYDDPGEMPSEGTGGFAEKSGKLSLVAVGRKDHRDFPFRFLGEEEKNDFYEFYHELGHIVVPSGYVGILSGFIRSEVKHALCVQKAECAADLYVCAMGLKKGCLDMQDVFTIAYWRRDKNNVVHGSHNALVWLAENCDKIDFKAMPPQEIVAFANSKSGEFLSKPEEIKTRLADERGMEAFYKTPTFS